MEEVVEQNKNVRKRNVVVNEWNDENVETVTRWQKELEITSFVYSDNAEYYDKYIQNIIILSQIMSAVIAIMSVVSITLGPIGGQWVIFGFDVAIALIAATVTVLNALIKIKNWDTFLRTYTNYSNDLNQLWIDIETELNMGSEHRIEADDFIKRIYGKYVNLKQNAPGITNRAATTSRRKYQNNVFENQVWNQKFNKLL